VRADAHRRLRGGRLARRATAPLGRLLLYGNSGGDPEPALTPRSPAQRQHAFRRVEHHDPRARRSRHATEITADAFALVAAGAVTLDVRHLFALD